MSTILYVSYADNKRTILATGSTGHSPVPRQGEYVRLAGTSESADSVVTYKVDGVIHSTVRSDLLLEDPAVWAEEQMKRMSEVHTTTVVTVVLEKAPDHPWLRVSKYPLIDK